MNRRMKAETRFILTMAIIIAIIVGVALYGYFIGAWEQSLD